MPQYRPVKGPDSQLRLQVPLRGQALLDHPLFNKSTAFSYEERAKFGLEGLLPDRVSTMELQSQRIYENMNRKTDPLEKYIGLLSLQDRNEHLFYRVLIDHIEEYMPIVYTPTVGEACKLYSHIFRRHRGCFITPRQKGRIYEVLGNFTQDVRLIVVTDNERILGLGDQGAGGMGIPVGKLSLYTAGAGIHPSQTLPISLDVGTDNAGLLADELYLGHRAPRLRGPEYDALVEEFVQAVKRRFPKALLQWEDFKKGNAFKLMERYKKTLPSFNDDIQGTAAIAVAGMMGGSRVSGIPVTKQRVVILGAGAAGVGIANLLKAAFAKAGVAGEALMESVALLDTKGFLADDHPIDDAHKRPFAWPAELAARRGLGKGKQRDLLGVVRALKPSMLIGTSGEPNTFTEEIIREMAKHVDVPVIFPMSNPTSKSEAKPGDIIRWTEGKAIIATGSPFDPVTHNGKLHRFGQGNNAFIFPGVGLGVLVSEAREVTDLLFAAAAERLAQEVRADDLRAGSVFPKVAELRRVTAAIAESVVRVARDTGIAGRSLKDEEIPGEVTAAIWTPDYLPYDPM